MLSISTVQFNMLTFSSQNEEELASVQLDPFVLAALLSLLSPISAPSPTLNNED
ncbi:UNVERIFIED_CONTAM: hypothetical protein FKN15_013794 [Acipenser sinensis]